MKRILMVAYHFPPLSGSSGIQRTLRFVQQLPAFNVQPVVLTASINAYASTSTDLVAEIPADTIVRRAAAWDTARQLSVAGRYLAFMARPDRWVSWRFDGVRQGMRLIHQYRPDFIWSTYPIATAHLIGAELHRRSGLPWIADFRDPMAQVGYPEDPLTWKAFSAIEATAALGASAMTFTTPGAVNLYRERFPQAAAKMHLLENGYDEESFFGLTSADQGLPLNAGAVTLLHSGIIYPNERDPSALFIALGRLAKAGKLRKEAFRIRFRAAVHDDLLMQLAERHGVVDLIELCPAIPYRGALAEMLRADGLLVLQGPGCNDQIPAKIYEYLRARRPILGITDHRGDTARVLLDAQIDTIASLNSADEIERALPDFVARVRVGKAPLPSMEAVVSASRLSRTRAFAKLIDELGTRRYVAAV